MKNLISENERKAIEQDGIYNLRVVRVQRDLHGYPNVLIEGSDHSGCLWRGWLMEGEGVTDIYWTDEEKEGWGKDARGRSLS